MSIPGLDLLRYVPFEALPLADGSSFGTRSSTAYLPDLVNASGNEGAIALIGEDRRRLGVGAGRLGEAGLDGLVGALLERGASCVVLAFEDVEPSAALEPLAPMQAAALSKDMSPRGALRLLHSPPAAQAGAGARAALHAIGRMPVLR